MTSYLVAPTPTDPRLTQSLQGQDQDGNIAHLSVVVERPLTLYLNTQEIVTMMTVGDHPNCLAVGYLLNQNMLEADDEIVAIDYDDDIDTIVVRTRRETNYEDRLKKKVRTSGCAQGTTFGDIMDSFDEVRLNQTARLEPSWIFTLSQKITHTDSLYLKSGAIHGCVLCQEDVPIIYMEDVGRHNAVDKIAGYMFLNNIPPEDKIFYTTGRLTSEMVIKTARMKIPILISRSGFTAWGVELARQVDLTLIGRAKGKRYFVLSGNHRLTQASHL